MAKSPSSRHYGRIVEAYDDWFGNGMEQFPAATYGERIADVYDAWYGPLDAEAAVAFLAKLAGVGPVLELGVGTGRIAVPLVHRGVDVHGIEASAAMVSRARDKPGGEKLQITLGDITEMDVDGEYTVVFAVFNTFFSALTQDAQVRCFANVAAHLGPSGVFVLEAATPHTSRFSTGPEVRTWRVEADRVMLEASRHDAATQRVTFQIVVLSEGTTRLCPVQIRYASAAELDLMARLAGLRLRERWAGWDRQPFNGDSVRHVSVYERAEQR